MTSEPTTSSHPLVFTVFAMGTPAHLVPGTWRLAADRQREYLTASYWREFAAEVERAPFHAIVLADSVGLQGASARAQARDIATGRQSAVVDALTVTPLLLASSRHVGVIPTVSVIQDHPFTLARRLSTLDHLFDGRIGWNVVANSLVNAARNFGYDSLPGREERYALADDVLTVCRRLWHDSWEPGALVADVASGRYAEPGRVHGIETGDTRFAVAGPHLLPRSPQVEPLIVQAGASDVGRDFVARNADLWLFGAPGPAAAAAYVADMRERLGRAGRDHASVRALQSVMPVVGATECEARAKADELEAAVTDEAMAAQVGTALQAEIEPDDLDRTLEDLIVAGLELPQGLQHALHGQSGNGAKPTLRVIGLQSLRAGRIVGAPEQIAAVLEAWTRTGIDGFNVMLASTPASLTDFVDGVVPILQSRGWMRTAPDDGATLREQVMRRVPERATA
jgi:long-chain alkane monooxygenase